MINDFSGDYAALSNFFYAPVFYQGMMFKTSEHAFQAAKTLNHEERLAISKLNTPKEAKSAGRKVTMISSWDRGTKYKAMQDILASKFSINQDCAEVLLGTENDYLVEGNWWHDNTWGVCSCSKCDNGQNALGVLLMYTRLKLQVKEDNA